MASKGATAVSDAVIVLGLGAVNIAVWAWAFYLLVANLS